MFTQAKPIFPHGKSHEMNIFAVFFAKVGCLKNAKMRITASSFYRLTVNGKFVAFGPARTAKGYARVDEISLSDLADKNNEILIEVSGYNCRGLSTVCQESFLIAEITEGEKVLAATGRDFLCSVPDTRIQKVPRYSAQRHFTEIWDFTERDRAFSFETPEILNLDLSFLDRVAPYPYYEDIFYPTASSVGVLEEDTALPIKHNFYSFVPEGQFQENEIEYRPYEWIQQFRQTCVKKSVGLPLVLQKNEYAIFDLSRMETGFFLLSATCNGNSDLILAFSEDSTPEHFEFTDMHAQNAMEILLPSGETDFQSFEPYVARYVILAVKEGTVRLDSFGIKTDMHDMRAFDIPKITDQTLRDIYRGGARTFAHNALDLYMDCPSRERAGWLCDTYFTAQTEYALLGDTQVENAFLENYLLFKDEGNYPDGVIPMVYPSDNVQENRFIPQWTMWFILEVEAYLNRRNKKADREKFRSRLEGLLNFYRRYENSDGLLESLPSWNFVEWSKANEWTKDVSYPTNFLYAEVLDCVYRIYGDRKYREKAEKVRKTTVEQSFDGTKFLDHAIRKDGVLVRLNDCSEACQYYAILFGNLDWKDEKYTELRRLVLTVFGAERTEIHPEIAEINAFIGAYLRLEVLLKLEENELVLKNVKDFFGNMEKETGTLWEYRQRHGSRDHGFASFALVAIQKALMENRLQ